MISKIELFKLLLKPYENFNVKKHKIQTNDIKISKNQINISHDEKL